MTPKRILVLGALTVVTSSFVASAQPINPKAPPFTVIETTRLSNVQLGKLVVQVEAQLDEARQAFSARAVIRQGHSLIQRFAIESDTRTYARGLDVIIPQDVDRDGNTDFWVIQEDSRNSVWVLYRFDSSVAKFVRDREWINPSVDPKTGCVIGRTNAGRSGGLSVLTVTCMANDQWDGRFIRDQTQTQDHVPRTDDCREDYVVKQTDHSVSPPKTQNFLLKCGGDLTDRLPRWVQQMYARAKQPSRRMK